MPPETRVRTRSRAKSRAVNTRHRDRLTPDANCREGPTRSSSSGPLLGSKAAVPEMLGVAVRAQSVPAAPGGTAMGTRRASGTRAAVSTRGRVRSGHVLGVRPPHSRGGRFELRRLVMSRTPVRQRERPGAWGAPGLSRLTVLRCSVMGVTAAPRCRGRLRRRCRGRRSTAR
jgi:hypothetical protein